MHETGIKLETRIAFDRAEIVFSVFSLLPSLANRNEERNERDNYIDMHENK